MYFTLQNGQFHYSSRYCLASHEAKHHHVNRTSHLTACLMRTPSRAVRPHLSERSSPTALRKPRSPLIPSLCFLRMLGGWQKREEIIKDTPRYTKATERGPKDDNNNAQSILYFCLLLCSFPASSNSCQPAQSARHRLR